MRRVLGVTKGVLYTTTIFLGVVLLMSGVYIIIPLIIIGEIRALMVAENYVNPLINKNTELDSIILHNLTTN